MWSGLRLFWLRGGFGRCGAGGVFRVLPLDHKDAAVIPFAQDFPSGVMRLAFSPDGSLYVGQTGRGWRAAGGNLDALVRLSESLAKMRLDEDVRSEDVAEARRLFKVSTMAANQADQNMAGGMGLGAGGDAQHQEMTRTEDFLRARMNLGSTVNRQRLIEEAAGQGFNAVVVARCFSVMIMRGEVMERNSGRLLKRVK